MMMDMITTANHVVIGTQKRIITQTKESVQWIHVIILTMQKDIARIIMK
jgi:hypothetical protein